jgi:hypothetical protein
MKVYLIVSILALVLIHPTFVRAQNCPPCYKNVPIIAGHGINNGIMMGTNKVQSICGDGHYLMGMLADQGIILL